MEIKKLNAAQIELLQVMSNYNSEQDLYDLKMALSSFFAKKADEKMLQFCKDGSWSPEKLNQLRAEHYRTPYK